MAILWQYWSLFSVSILRRSHWPWMILKLRCLASKEGKRNLRMIYTRSSHIGDFFAWFGKNLAGFNEIASDLSRYHWIWRDLIVFRWILMIFCLNQNWQPLAGNPNRRYCYCYRSVTALLRIKSASFFPMPIISTFQSKLWIKHKHKGGKNGHRFFFFFGGGIERA